jgi:hypothetical protein
LKPQDKTKAEANK